MSKTERSIFLDPIFEYLANKDPESRECKRILTFLEILKQPQIPMTKLKEQCFSGIPDSPKNLRVLCWLLMLQVLSPDTQRWEIEAQRNNENYKLYLQEFLGFQKWNKPLQTNEQDHPLNKNKDSQWQKFFKDQDLWEEIEKDTRRTRADMHFFLSKSNLEYKHFIAKFACKQQETHTDILTRILFLYAKLNPGVNYIQGMNEVLAPIYFLFSQWDNEKSEEISFFAFSRLMSDLMDCFLRSLDDSKNGIHSRLQDLDTMIQFLEPQIYQKFQFEKIVPQFYALRWIMLLFTQEFNIANVHRLWDSMLSIRERAMFVTCISAAHVLTKKPIIMDGEFTDIMTALTDFSDCDIEKLLLNSFKIFLQNFKKEIQKLQ